MVSRLLGRIITHSGGVRMAHTNSLIISESAIRVAVALAMLSASGPLMADDGTIEEGQRLLEGACLQCHPLRPTEVTRDGRQGWEDTVHKMVVFGAQLSVEEMDVLVEYLTKHYGPAAGKMSTGKLPPGAAGDPAGGLVTSANITLPPGEGRDLVQALCSGCHDMGRIVATPRSAVSWRRYTENMLAQGGIPATDEQIASAVAYLSSHFGGSPESR